MKSSMLKKLGIGLTVTAFCGTSVLMAMASTSVITEPGAITEETLSDGVTYRQEMGAKNDNGSQNIFTVTYDYTDPNYDLAIGGNIGDRNTVTEMAQMLNEVEGYTVVAGVNGDHFSYTTGVPMGFSMDDGEILESPTTDKNADGYMFYSFGITRDGDVVTGYNPTLIATYQKEDSPIEDRVRIDSINRTRESWSACNLYTEAYGASTKTTETNGTKGLELVIDVKSGSVSPQANPLVGEVVAINQDDNSPIGEGQVVLSAEGTAMNALENYQVGDRIEMNFSFVEEEWNYVDFAIGGHYSIVQNGQPMELTYDDPDNPDDDGSPFNSLASRTGVGMTADGKLVIVATDGRGAGGGQGFTANEMAHYMAEELNCENAILLDGGGSTEMVTMDGDEANIRNTPSDGSERRVGNGLFLVKLDTPRAPETDPTAPTAAPVTEPVNLLPSDLSGATGSNATAVYEGETLKVTSTAADATFTFPVGKEYNISKLPSMFFTVDAEVGFDIRVNYTGIRPGVVGIVSDYGPNFGVGTSGYLNAGLYDDKGENEAQYVGMVNFIGGPSYNGNIPDDNMITIDSIEIRLQNSGVVSLDALYMCDAASDNVPSPIPTASSTDSTESTDTTASSTDPTQSTDTSSTDSSVTDTTATDATTDGTTEVTDTTAGTETTRSTTSTTAHTSPDTGYGMGALALAGMLLAVSASGIYFCRKAKVK